MKVSFTPTTFVNDTSPAWNATQANLMGAGIEANADALTDIPIDSAAYLSAGSSSSNYNVTSYRTSAPPSGEIPIAIIITPTITNIAGATLTPTWGATAYPIYDLSTNAQVIANVIKANQPTIFVFDGTNFWVNGGGNYLQLSTTATAGKFNTTTTAPTNTTRLNYEGYMYATRFYGAVYNDNADFAEAYPVIGDVESGDVIAITDEGRFVKNTIYGNTKILGIVSDEYAFLLGLQFGDTPIAESGRVHAKVIGTCDAGDYLVGSDEIGTLTKCNADEVKRGAICARALVQKKDYGVEKILVQIVRM